MQVQQYVLWYEQLGMQDVERVGGKNASLGEMISNLSGAGVSVPGGFATTAFAFNEFLESSGLNGKIHDLLDSLDVDDIAALNRAGQQIRDWVIEAPFPERAGTGDPGCLRQAQRAMTTRGVALSAGIQRMVRSDLAASGVMFTLDTESGFNDVVFITGAQGLGEMVVQGAVNPDEFYVHKPTLKSGRPAVVRKTLGSKLIKMTYSGDASHGRQVQIVDTNEAERSRFCITDAEVMELAKQALIIEQHYGRPMDIEWAKDGQDGKLYIVQARPETVRSRQEANTLERFALKQAGKVLIEGRAIGHKIGAGPARVISSISQMDEVQPGDVLVTDMTDPDWEPIMKRASAIVTNRGGRTCHAAIIARELGIPAVVGCGDATKRIEPGQLITVSCAEGDTGFIYDGELDFDVAVTEVGNMPRLPIKIMMNVGNPDRAFDFAQLPNAGVGLARLEFIINRMIGVHPKALLEFDQQSPELKATIGKMIAGYESPREFLRRQADRGHRHPGRRLLAGAGDRADVGLQVQRVRQPGGRP
ncbi:UNVERIFIED_CONTAM: hypothetical protein K2H54_000402 [Gekko kuhli]